MAQWGTAKRDLVRSFLIYSRHGALLSGHVRSKLEMMLGYKTKPAVMCHFRTEEVFEFESRSVVVRMVQSAACYFLF